MTDLLARLKAAARKPFADGCTMVPRWAADHREMAALLREARDGIAALEAEIARLNGRG
jgi:hypothetical protein